MRIFVTFSQRYEYEGFPECLKLNELSIKLRKELWESIFKELKIFNINPSRAKINWYYIFRELYIGYFQSEIEQYDFSSFSSQLKKFIKEEECHRVLSLIEILSNEIQKKDLPNRIQNDMVLRLQKIFENNLAAYTLIFESSKWQFFPAANEYETKVIRLVLEKTENKFKISKDHLLKAAKFLNEGLFLDAIRESISGVEATTKVVLNDQKITLGDAIKRICEVINLHPAVQKSISAFYGFANDSSGIRHSKKPGEQIPEDERYFAQCFFGVSASFISYLINLYESKKFVG